MQAGREAFLFEKKEEIQPKISIERQLRPLFMGLWQQVQSDMIYVARKAGFLPPSWRNNWFQNTICDRVVFDMTYFNNDFRLTSEAIPCFIGLEYKFFELL